MPSASSLLYSLPSKAGLPCTIFSLTFSLSTYKYLRRYNLAHPASIRIPSNTSNVADIASSYSFLKSSTYLRRRCRPYIRERMNDYDMTQVEETQKYRILHQVQLVVNFIAKGVKNSTLRSASSKQNKHITIPSYCRVSSTLPWPKALCVRYVCTQLYV